MPGEPYATSFVARITASAYINDDERRLLADYEGWMEELAPHAPLSQYRHNRTGKACPEFIPSTTEGPENWTAPTPT